MQLGLSLGASERDARQGLNGAWLVMRVIDLEGMPCSRRYADRLQVGRRDSCLLFLKSADVATLPFGPDAKAIDK